MNIFVIDESPRVCAEYLSADKIRHNKQIIECGQILATALWLNNAPSKYFPYCKSGEHYKPTHKHHPVVKWAGRTQGNFFWVLDYMKQLCKLKTNNVCKSNLNLLEFAGNNFVKFGEREKFCNCTPYKTENVYKAYVKHLNNKWGKV